MVKKNSALRWMLVGCLSLGGESGHSAEPATLDLATARLIDLSYTFDPSTLYWPTSPTSFELKVLHHGPTAGGYFYASNSFCSPEHGGTHLDAPIHFGEGKDTAEVIPLRRLIAPAVVIDVAQKAAARAGRRGSWRCCRTEMADASAKNPDRFSWRLCQVSGPLRFRFFLLAGGLRKALGKTGSDSEPPQNST